jgi:Prokaryotic membrane lipoprotein lipid attachment site
MKKIAIVLFVAAAALAGCGKKNAPASPTTPSGGSAMGSGDMGSGAPAGSGGDMGGSGGM